MATTTFTPSQLRGINSSFPYKNYGLWAPEITGGGGGGGFTNTYSLAFDGVDDYVDLGTGLDIFQYNIGQSYTVSLWYKSTSSSLDRTIINLGGNTYKFYLATGNGKLAFGAGNNSTIFGNYNWLPTAGAINDGQWHHICIVQDSSGGVPNLTAYVDGSSSGSGSNTNFATQNNNRIGNGFYGGVEGNIDEVSVYNTALTSSTITSIYNSGVPNDLTSLNPVAWYRNGDNGTWKSPQWLIPNNENKTKFSNYSFEYDGIDDFVDLGSITFNATNGLTMSCWVKYDGVGAGLNWLCSNGNTGGVSSQFNTRLVSDGRWFNYFVGGANYTGITGLNDGNWHHIAQTVNYTTGDVKFYKDGVVSATVLTYGSTYSTAILAQISTSFFPFKGQIDEFAIFESIENISNLYNSGVPTDISSLSPVGYWRSEQSIFTDNWLVDNSALSNYSTRSFNFDGINDYINTGTNSLIGASTLTISVWFKSSDVDFQYLLGDNSVRFNIKQSNGDTRISFTGSVDPFRGFGVPYNVGEWNNIILTFDGSLVQADRLKLYHNGVEINNINAGTPNTTLLLNTAASFMIGRAGSTSSNPWNGNIDEVAYWDSVEDASTIYNSGTPADISSLSPISHWRMGEDATFNTNWSLPDNGSASNTGTSANMAIADLEGDAPNYTGGGLSNNMTIEDRVGDASNSSNNALSYNMDEADRETDVPS